MKMIQHHDCIWKAFSPENKIIVPTERKTIRNSVVYVRTDFFFCVESSKKEKQ